MIVTIAVVGGLLGLALLLLPRGWMLFGQRWALQDGERAEPSDLYVASVRVIGVVVIVATAISSLWLAGLQRDNVNEADLEEIWEVQLYSSDTVDVVIDPPISTSYPQNLGDRQVVLAPTHTAVVGEDEIGELGRTFEDGDLLVGMGYTACTFRKLIVTQEDGKTVVGIVVELAGDSDTSILEPYQRMDLCTRRFSTDGTTTGLTIFRVREDG